MRISAQVVVLAILLLSPVSSIAKSDDVSALPEQVEGLFDQGKYEEAVPLAEQALEITEASVAHDHPGLIPPLWW